MAQTKRDPKRKQKLINYKQSNQRNMESKNQPKVAPEVLQQPVWDSSATIEMNGAEFEAIVRALDAVGQGNMAITNVINRNLLNGTVRMQYFKPGANGRYEPLSAEESKPYEEQLQTMIQQAKEIADKAVNGEVPPTKLDGITNQYGQTYDDIDLGKKPDLKVVE